MKNAILITGATGFIGKHLLKKIPNHISTFGKDGKNVDLRFREKVMELKKVETVIHLAGKIPSKKNFSKNVFFEHNVLGTLNILEYCVKNKIKKIIFVSSYIYGNPKKNPVNERQFIQPHNAYTKSKFLAEELCKNYGEKFGIKIIILRPFNVFGSSLKKDFFISNILKSIKNNKPITIVNKNDKRDYLFVDDLVDAIIKMIDYDCEFEIFNVGSGKCISFEKLICLFEKKSGKKIKKVIKTSKEKHISKIQADITKIKSKTGWSPKYSIEEGVEAILLEKELLS